MVTPKFIALWFLFSALLFGVLYRLHKEYFKEQMNRDLNGLCILMSQGLGAAIAYAIYS